MAIQFTWRHGNDERAIYILHLFSYARLAVRGYVTNWAPQYAFFR